MSSIKVRAAEDGPFPINDKLAGLVPMAIESEQAVLRADISHTGQVEPIVLWRGEVVDGRCRQAALGVLGKDVLYKELDPETPEADVASFVKAVNTRRNLTMSQKITVACKQYAGNRHNTTIPACAQAWGISEKVLKNALWVYRTHPAVIETIFDGGSVTIVDDHGTAIQTNKVSTVYAYYKKLQEAAVEVDRGWKEDSYITTQAGKEWYYKQLRTVGEVNWQVKMLLAELANFKFTAQVNMEE